MDAGRRVPRHRVRPGLVGLMVAIGAIVVAAAAAPASAHTSLVSSTPADGTVSERAPDELSLLFATPIDLESLELRLEAGDGSPIDVLVPRRPAGTPADALTTSLPDLEPGVYVLRWVSIGDDGHRATGEVVFGIGAVALADLRVAGGGSTGIDEAVVAGGVLRWLFVLALAGAVGGLLAVRFARRHGDDDPLAEVVAARGRLAVEVGLAMAAGLLLGRVAVVVWTRLDFADGLGDAVTASLATAAAVAVAVAVGTWQLRRMRRRAGWFPLLDGVASVLLVVLALASALIGHAGASDLGAPAVVVAAAHGLAAAVWVGPLLVGIAVLADRRWRHAPPGTALTTAREAGRAFAPVAAVSVVVLAVTGPGLALLEGTWSELSGTFRSVLVVKAVLLVAVLLPLGALHDRRLGWLAARRPDRSSRLPRRTLAVEAVALVAVLAAGTVLASANPLRQLTGGASLLATVTDPEDCDELSAGQMSCYRRYFAGVLDADGAAAAAAELDRLAAAVPAVASQCHQLAHDLGNDAVAAFGSVAEALVQAPPTCWSGYYHGVVELAVSGLGSQPTTEELAAVCGPLAERVAYSVEHYNCVHGLGHGTMLLTDHDLFGALELCEAIEDVWERDSCFGGAFMERVISIQASPERDDAGDDLLYPCSRVEEHQLEQCFLMQSSYFLWRLGHDYEAGFALCDQAPASVIDTCYRSMGRDIAANTRHDPGAVLDACTLGAATYVRSCVTAAALDAALDALDPAAGDPVCRVLSTDDDVAACLGEIAVTFPDRA